MDVVCLGLMVCDILVKPITKALLDSDSARVDFVKMNSGGDAFNVSVVLSKLGVHTAIIGKVGNDGFGKFLLETAGKNGVDCSGTALAEETGTSASVVLIHPDGERSFAYYGGASDILRENDINFDLVKKAKILSIGSALALPCLDGPGLARILEKAQNMGIETVVDVTEVRDDGSRSRILPLLKHTGIFIPSYAEARIITGKDTPEEMAEVILEYGVKIFAVKLGSEGCFLCSKDEAFHIPPFTVDAVDCTGAGDSFVAGFIAAYRKGWSLRDCGKFANAAGALCVREIGATEGIRSFDQVVCFMNRENL